VTDILQDIRGRDAALGPGIGNLNVDTADRRILLEMYDQLHKEAFEDQEEDDVNKEGSRIVKTPKPHINSIKELMAMLAANEEATVYSLLSANDRADIENRFSYHAPKDGQPETYATIRDAAKQQAALIYLVCPAGRERRLAITNLEQAVMWANASIARS
jgi:hypothetical protein